MYSINCKAQQKYNVSRSERTQLIMSPIRNTCTEGFRVLPLALCLNVIKWLILKQRAMNLLIHTALNTIKQHWSNRLIYLIGNVS